MSDHVERLGAIATFLQREDDELLYSPDDTAPQTSRIIAAHAYAGCPFPHPAPLPIQGEVGLSNCPSCGADGRPLGCAAWYAETSPDGEKRYTLSYYCNGACGYCAWKHVYRVDSTSNFSRQPFLYYVETNSFGICYPWTTERQAVPEHLKERCRG